MKKCLNCGAEFTGGFCPECGQSAETGRFTMRFIFENLLAAFISKDGGIGFTFRNLFTRPGAMIVEILNGKRRKYFSPFPLLFFTLTVYILLYSLTGSRGSIRAMEQELAEAQETIDVDLEEESIDILSLVNEMRKLTADGLRFYNSHYTTVTMLTIPFFLFATRAWFGKNNRRRYYRAEYLVTITYSMVMVVLYRCLMSLMYLVSVHVSDIMAFWVPIVNIAAFTACFHKMLGFSIAKTAWRSLLAYVLYLMILGTILLVICVSILVVLILPIIKGEA